MATIKDLLSNMISKIHTKMDNVAGAEPHKQLMTDEMGNVKWGEQTHYKGKKLISFDIDPVSMGYEGADEIGVGSTCIFEEQRIIANTIAWEVAMRVYSGELNEIVFYWDGVRYTHAAKRLPILIYHNSNYPFQLLHIFQHGAVYALDFVCDGYKKHTFALELPDIEVKPLSPEMLVGREITEADNKKLLMMDEEKIVPFDMNNLLLKNDLTIELGEIFEFNFTANVANTASAVYTNSSITAEAGDIIYITIDGKEYQYIITEEDVARSFAMTQLVDKKIAFAIQFGDDQFINITSFDSVCSVAKVQVGKVVNNNVQIPAEYITGTELTEADNGKVLGVENGQVALVEQSGGLPEGSEPHKQLVTNAEGKAVWEDRLAWNNIIVDFAWDGNTSNPIYNPATTMFLISDSIIAPEQIDGATCTLADDDHDGYSEQTVLYASAFEQEEGMPVYTVDVKAVIVKYNLQLSTGLLIVAEDFDFNGVTFKAGLYGVFSNSGAYVSTLHKDEHHSISAEYLSQVLITMGDTGFVCNQSYEDAIKFLKAGAVCQIVTGVATYELIPSISRGIRCLEWEVLADDALKMYFLNASADSMSVLKLVYSSDGTITDESEPV